MNIDEIKDINSHNEHCIILTCPYVVYRSEWEDIAHLIEKVMPDDFKAINVEVAETDDSDR